MRILHSESSPGWGGQEIRILREAKGMQGRGHEIIMAIQKGGGLVEPARKAGFKVYELDFRKRRFLSLCFELSQILLKEKIQVINTHSSVDAWSAGLVGKIMRRHVVRTRHLSTPVKGGLNGYLLYNFLADEVVTTCAEVVDILRVSAKLKDCRCRSVPTGIDPTLLEVSPTEVEDFRKRLGVKPSDVLVGTLCVIRGWKGISDMLEAAKLLKEREEIKWVVVGSGASEAYFKSECARLGLEKRVIFTGHISPPFAALKAFDIFTLLSWAHEGVSQASLQAAYLKKPLVTTRTGGLKEVCLNEKTGLIVDCNAPDQVANAIERLADSVDLRLQFGEEAHRLVANNFLFEQTLDAMERVVLKRRGSPGTSPTPLSPQA